MVRFRILFMVLRTATVVKASAYLLIVPCYEYQLFFFFFLSFFTCESIGGAGEVAFSSTPAASLLTWLTPVGII